MTKFYKNNTEIKPEIKPEKRKSSKQIPYSKVYSKGITAKGLRGFQRLNENESMTENISFTLTKEQKKLLQEYCLKNDISQSSLLRKYVLDLIQL